MEGTDFEFDKWDRVRLRSTVDPSFYGNFAVTGNEGWIADRRRDGRFGLPEVFIKWDKNHWTYNGAPDRWTFQEHFELVKEEEDMPEDNNELFKQFQEFMKSKGKGDTTGPEPRSKPSKDDEYQQAVEDATEVLGHCESFVIVGVTRREHPDAPKGVLVPVALSFAKNPESELLSFCAASQYAAEAHQKLVIDTISDLAEDE